MTRGAQIVLSSIGGMLVFSIVLANTKVPGRQGNLLGFIIHHKVTQQCVFNGKQEYQIVTTKELNQDCLEANLKSRKPTSDSSGKLDFNAMEYNRQQDSYCNQEVNVNKAIFPETIAETEVKDVYFGIPITKSFCPKHYGT